MTSANALFVCVSGPLLFLLYINDIHLSSDKLKFYLFTDDTNLLYADKNLKAIEQMVNVELNNVHDWLITNRLTLNTKNRSAMRTWGLMLSLTPFYSY